MTLGFLLNPRLVLWTMYQPLEGSASDLCSTNLSNSRVSLEVAVWAKQLQRRLRPSCVETSKLRSVIWWLSFKDEEPQIMIMYLYILCNTTLSIFSSIRICSRRNPVFSSVRFFLLVWPFPNELFDKNLCSYSPKLFCCDDDDFYSTPLPSVHLEDYKNSQFFVQCTTVMQDDQ